MASGFIITPFSSELSWLTDMIREAGDGEGVTFQRADDVFQPGVIIDQILDAIDETDVVVAVTTGRNPNVFFELGYAWRKHHPILLAEGVEDMPFDVAAWRHLLYGPGTPGANPVVLAEQLRSAIRSVLQEGRPLPRGHLLQGAPSHEKSARVHARFEHSGSRGGGRLVLRNSGTVDVQSVDVEIPADAALMLHGREELPIDILRPGEAVQIVGSASLSMGDTRRTNFDVVVTGRVDDEPREWPCKVSV